MIRSLVALLICLFGAVALLVSAPAGSSSISDQARKLHFSSIVVDTHDDTTQRLFSKDFDLGARNATGHIDIPRMREGGLGAIFFSIWIDGRIMGPPAIQKASTRSMRCSKTSGRIPKTSLARTADDVRRAHKEKKSRS